MSEGTRAGATVSRGAEATLREGDWWGFAVLIKDREAKGYRPKEFDDRLRKERIRTEARLLLEARRAGVRTPLIYDVDMTHARIIMERLPGPTLKQILEDPSTDRTTLEGAVRRFGQALGRLHSVPISHGDLTSSNVLFPEGPQGPPALLDLSMGSRQPGIEELGIDLHLVEEDFKSLVPQSETLVRAFLAGYAEGNPNGQSEVIARARAIRGRVRYA
ncbi:O-sialoglycoprotein endopeptidase/protein kinase [mine drainage metagenome]|uniref:non-specific serine/threonine protein kinase n=1 Tax=mine drainage metagenome TaxID=410659 RepID=T1BJ95_9ZZZZ